MLSSNTSAVSGDANYIEDVFSTYLYTGNGNAARSITNGIDLSTKGGMVWLKNRTNAYYNNLFDTARGVEKRVYSNTTDAQVTTSGSLTAFNTDGFSLGTASFGCNDSGNNIASWTFRKQPKFFDVVPYTGNGTAGRTVAHSLGSVPGCIIVKRTDSAGFDWAVYHRSLSASGLPARFCSIFLNQTSAAGQYSTFWNETDPTSTDFTVGTSSSVNTNGATYVAYIFAHNAGGFGLTGTDNVISCGSYTETSGTVSVNLGYEPQWLLVKPTSTTGSWYLVDNMRGFSQTADAVLFPNLSNAESAYTPYWKPTATGFTVDPLFGAGTSFIYIAIRRGPMKVPTDGTKVFIPVTQTDGGTVTTNFPVDLTVNGDRSSWGASWFDRLRGGSSNTYAVLQSFNTSAEGSGTGTGSIGFQNNTGYRDYWNNNGIPAIYWSFRRAPSFFDEVCYTYSSGSPAKWHNLGVVPELMIFKCRDNYQDWYVYHKDVGVNDYLVLNTAAAKATSTGWVTALTSSSFTAYLSDPQKYVAYLFATCAGVSKVGSYTGTGTTKQVDCGFAAGARFVLIKRTDSTGDWYVWDTARGIVSGNDPYLLLNSTAAETTTTDYIDTYSAGFELSSTAPAALNASGGTYIFLAIA